MSHHLSVFTEVFQVLLLLILGSCWRDQPFHVQWKSFSSSRDVSQFSSYDIGRSVQVYPICAYTAMYLEGMIFSLVDTKCSLFLVDYLF